MPILKSLKTEERESKPAPKHTLPELNLKILPIEHLRLVDFPRPGWTLEICLWVATAASVCASVEIVCVAHHTTRKAREENGRKSLRNVAYLGGHCLRQVAGVEPNNEANQRDRREDNGHKASLVLVPPAAPENHTVRLDRRIKKVIPRKRWASTKEIPKDGALVEECQLPSMIESSSMYRRQKEAEVLIREAAMIELNV
ncbi:hypothetical protein SBOR_6140 [Sclerotinia borealis F-4128]|uniref:Uncharacterized protein n=1 Tax=Sclerotinia borealis (strain F-4128) TaxID=1432307 RepID=W9CCA0_SCLBF|nr:hypothetical protein SBOR_6140 [Sclerotinia borealis F-4128]